MKIETWPNYDPEEIKKASNILASGKVNYWTGEEGHSFEREFAEKVGVKYAIALSNGSIALSAAYAALGLGPGDELITTPRTFIATASSAVLLGIKPIFADVDFDSGNITAETIAPLITKRTKAISVVHLAGWPANMDEICKLAKNHNLSVLEDCAQAHGAKIKGKSVGSFGDIAAWSFCQDKIISTAGEGGMITTNREDLWKTIWESKDHGKSYNSVFHKTHPPGFRWVHERFGTNYRLSEIQSAIGRIQLSKLDEWNKKRSSNALVINNTLKDIDAVYLPEPPGEITHGWYKYHLYIKREKLSSGWSRERIISEINNQGYPAFQGSCSEIYLEKCFKDASLAPSKRLKVARALGDSSIMLLIHPTIASENMEEYAKVVRNILLKSLL